MFTRRIDRSPSNGRDGSRTTPFRRAGAASALGILTATRLFAQSATPAAELGNLKQLSLEELTQVEVTSVSGEPEKLIDTASAVQVISGDDIRRSGFTTIADSLRLADNLNVAQKDPHDWAISARGFNSNLGDKLLVLIDGRTVYTPLFSGVFWNAQDYLLEDIDHIEVISGPGGTLWGANAVNGVINIITKSADSTQGWYAETEAGTELQGAAAIRYGAKLAPDVYIRTYAKFEGYGDGRLTDGSHATDSWRQGQGGFRLDATPSTDNTFSLHGDYYTGTEDLQSGGKARIAGANIVGKWSHVFDNGSDMSLQLYYDRTHLDDPFAASPFAPEGSLVDELDTYDVDFQDRFNLGLRNHIIWGLGYRITADRVVQEAPNFAFLPPDLTQNRYSAFIQDEAKITDDVFATIGSKFEHNDFTGWELEPNARLRWEITTTQNLWAAISRAVRMPSRLDRDLAEPGPPKTLISGGSDFMSETVVAYELGYRQQVTPAASFSFSVFYNDYNDLRSLSPTPVTVLPLVYKNGLEGRSYGLEFSGDISLTSWWRLHGGYDLLKEKIKVKPGQLDFFNALDETADPENQISLRSSMDVTRSLQLDLMLRWIDTLRVDNGGKVGTVPSYAELNVRVGWQLTRTLEASLVGQNLLHNRHAEFGPPSAAREELQRSLYAKLDWRF